MCPYILPLLELLSEIQTRLPQVKSRPALAELARQGTEEGQLAKGILSKLSGFTSNVREGMRQTSPELDARLFYWGYTSTVLKEEESVRAFQRLYPNQPFPAFRQN